MIYIQATFDLKFLKEEIKRCDSKLSFDNEVFCTLKISRRLIPTKCHKLSNLQSIIGFRPTSGHKNHRALDDVHVTVKLWHYLVNVLNTHAKNQNNLQINFEFLSELSSMPIKKAHEIFVTPKTYDSSDIITVANKENIPLNRSVPPLKLESIDNKLSNHVRKTKSADNM